MATIAGDLSANCIQMAAAAFGLAALQRFSAGLVKKACGALMMIAAGLLASKDLQPQR